MCVVDAESAKLLWKLKVEENPVAQIGRLPTLGRGAAVAKVPMASSEERAGGMSNT